MCRVALGVSTSDTCGGYMGRKVATREVRGVAGWPCAGCEAQAGRPAMAGSSLTAGTVPSEPFQPWLPARTPLQRV